MDSFTLSELGYVLNALANWDDVPGLADSSDDAERERMAITIIRKVAGGRLRFMRHYQEMTARQFVRIGGKTVRMIVV